MVIFHFFQELECMLKLKIPTIKKFCHVYTAPKVCIKTLVWCAWHLIIQKNVTFRRQIPIHISYTWWTHHLLVLEHITMVQRISVARSFWHSSWWACCWLCPSCPKRETHRIAIAYSSIAQPSGPNHQRTELSTGKFLLMEHESCVNDKW